MRRINKTTGMWIRVDPLVKARIKVEAELEDKTMTQLLLDAFDQYVFLKSTKNGNKRKV